MDDIVEWVPQAVAITGLIPRTNGNNENQDGDADRSLGKGGMYGYVYCVAEQS